MATCPDGHQSASEDYCDVCGMLISGAPSAPSAPTGAAPPDGFSVSALAGPSTGSASGGAGGDTCPNCNAPRSGVFCESCGYNFATGAAVSPAKPDAPASAPADGFSAPVGFPAPDASASPVTQVAPVAPDASASATRVAPSGAAPSGAALTGWTAVVAADRAYYDSVETASGPDGSGIDFPPYCPERRFQLVGNEMRIGRRSPSRGIEPEIDLTGPPTDPGISRLHAVLIATPDGWAVIDPGSANGTQLNGADIPTGMQLTLHDGDRINLGAWTTITVHGS
jgi:hypothetical protein